jgi:streptomycin 6-kinase
MMLKISDRLRETIERVHGERGRQWLVSLPALLSECRERWSLQLDDPFENLSYNLVLPGRMSDGTEIVLKAGVPCPELWAEAAALSHYDGEGAVRLLDRNARLGILLLERVLPGTPLHLEQDDEEATRTAARLMRRLWRTPPAGRTFPSLAVWFSALARVRNSPDGGSLPFPRELIERAEHTFAALSASSDRNVFLHGDLHHDNILSSSGKGWMAIDPKGIAGDPGYEVGSFMLNQLPADASEPATIEMLSRRLSIFSEELMIGRKRLARWAFCHAVLSAWWDFEESAECHGTIRLAQLLGRIE